MKNFLEKHKKGFTLIRTIRKNLVSVKAFTLIELLVVISILGILATLVIANVNEARGRARDSRKKADMAQLRTALKLYYNDFTRYPASSGMGCDMTSINSVKGCGPTGTACCPVAGCPEFSSGTDCSTVYMNKLPVGMGNNTIGYFSDGNEKFCIKTTLDNASDPDIASSHTGCGSVCTAVSVTLAAKEFAICSD